ncbi:MAG TPA: UDP-N-acetylglucosamine 2-epimerase (non-hydrolyzing) [Thermoleophilia bacterium]|nr:UDP-N-acetylglucosamine 2-epimerase (non-hydrolyzing) [Thermoleophilia bacterium]
MTRHLVLSVIGNRPQYIKAAVVSRAVRAVAREIVLDTGQHYDHELAGVFYEELALPRPDIALGVGSDGHARQTAAMLTGVADAVDELRPAVVLVYGDTNSTLAGALAAAKLQVPVAHVEAGLRSFDRAMPEELNRVLTDHLASLLFCPTDTAVANLAHEGIEAGVVQTGDVMFDLATATLTPQREHEVLSRRGLERGRYVMATVHRPATADDPARLGAVLDALGDADETVVFPAHPRTAASIERFGLGGRVAANVRLIAPVGYAESLTLVKNARVVATDSGGLQKEAYFFAVPCVTLRDTSEWVETVESGWNVLAGTDRATIAAALARPPRGDRHPDYYGHGDAAERVAAALNAYLEGRSP